MHKYWLILNEHNQPIFSPEYNQLFIFVNKKDAVYVLKNRSKIDKKYNTVRQILPVYLSSIDEDLLE